MYFKGINGLYDDIARSTFLPMDVRYKCQNWGLVYFELILDENGIITEKNILKTPDKMLNKVVFASLKYLGEFKPAYHNGKPVKSRILLRSQFNKPIVTRK